ncbi:MAG: PAAR domain-containing protein [Desulfamplus sp.]
MPTGPPVMSPHRFEGTLSLDLSTDVFIMGKPAVTAGSVAVNDMPHLPSKGSFIKPPGNQGKILFGSRSVFINKKGAARNGDTAMTCNDPVDQPKGKVIAGGTVMIG